VASDPTPPRTLRLLLAGDVMTGRGIDQVLAHPGDPRLHEAWVHDAREYVRIAERASGPVPAPVPPAYPWGDALAEMEAARPDLRIVNLETAITTADDAWPGKGIHYRMHPANVGCLTAAGIDACSLANNHVLDWGRAGWRRRWTCWSRRASAAPAPAATPSRRARPRCCSPAARASCCRRGHAG